jgi:catechol-2,3-dioxygenase
MPHTANVVGRRVEAMTRIRKLGHIVLFVRDLEASADWYCDILGMERVTAHEGIPAVFLSFGRRDHDIALFKVPDGRALGHHDAEHFAFEIDGDLDALRAFKARLDEKGVTITGTVDHGISYGVYFLDPDGHQLEVFHQRVGSDEEAKRMLGEIGAIAKPVDLNAVDS